MDTESLPHGLDELEQRYDNLNLGGDFEGIGDGPFFITEQKPVPDKGAGKLLYRIARTGDDIIISSLVETLGDIIGAHDLLASLMITYKKERMRDKYGFQLHN